MRTGHATTTLIRAGERVIIIDPSLPEPAVRARLDERAGIAPDDVTHVMLTSFDPELRRAIRLFDHAAWWIGHDEREQVGVRLAVTLHRAAEEEHDDLAETLRQEVALLKRCEPAPDRLAPGVDLFPLPGVTPGLCGVLIEEPERTTLVCGDAIPTVEHLRQRMILPSAVDAARARASFAEAVEIADVLILGRDNIVSGGTGRPF
jgi:glyoxylase-like metal-dependent hydrolase (beta-lactamase superfamily II)